MNKRQNTTPGRCNGQGKGNRSGQGKCQGGSGRCRTGAGQGRKGQGQGRQAR